MVIITSDLDLVRKSKRLRTGSPSGLLDITHTKIEDIKDLQDIIKHVYGIQELENRLEEYLKNTELCRRIKALAFISDIVNRGTESTYIIETDEFNDKDIEYIKTNYNKYNIVLYNSISRA